MTVLSFPPKRVKAQAEIALREQLNTLLDTVADTHAEKTIRAQLRTYYWSQADLEYLLRQVKYLPKKEVNDAAKTR